MMGDGMMSMMSMRLRSWQRPGRGEIGSMRENDKEKKSRRNPLQFLGRILMMAICGWILCLGWSEDVLGGIRRMSGDGPGMAVVIQAGMDNIRLLPDLFDTLYSHENDYAVLLDSSVSGRIVEGLKIRLRLAERTNVILLSGRPTSYEGISYVLNVMESMTELSNKSARWSYFILFEAHDFPLVTMSALRTILAEVQDPPLNFFDMRDETPMIPNNASKDQEYLTFDPALTMVNPDSFLQSPRQFSLLVSDMKSIYPERQVFHTLSSTRNFILTREFVEYLISGALPRHLLVNFANVFGAPKHFFATVASCDPVFSKVVANVSLTLGHFDNKGNETHRMLDLPSMMAIENISALAATSLYDPDGRLRLWLSKQARASHLGRFGEDLRSNILSRANDRHLRSVPIITRKRYE